MILKLLLVTLVSTSAVTMADAPSCKESDSSGTQDVPFCPYDRPWHCYTNYTCEDGISYTIWGSCVQNLQECW